MYLDHNATAPPSAGVSDRVAELMSDAWGNPASVHHEGVRARRVLDEARSAVAELVSAPPSRLVLTSGATEANTTAVAHLARRGRRLVTVSTEHPSVLAPLRTMAAAGRIELTIVDVDGAGRVDLMALETALSTADGLALMAANNETGVISDLEAVATLVEAAGVPWHCDAVQLVGRHPIVLSSEPWRTVSTLSFSAHKLGGPKGVGALVTSAHVDLTPLIEGGSQQKGLRAGTPPVAAIGGFAVAAQESQRIDWHAVADRRNRLESEITDRFPESLIHAQTAPRLPNTSSVALRVGSRWADGEDLAIRLAELGVAVSTGAACASGDAQPSHVLIAMGADALQAQATLRFSLGPYTEDRDIEGALKFLEVAIEGQFHGAG